MMPRSQEPPDLSGRLLDRARRQDVADRAALESRLEAAKRLLEQQEHATAEARRRAAECAGILDALQTTCEVYLETEDSGPVANALRPLSAGIGRALDALEGRS